ncbi:MAG: AMP-binding protein [Deltaproteobacteria bacterium]|nr:AMP-binding protein [Deltaproteobacteria bacterium]
MNPSKPPHSEKPTDKSGWVADRVLAGQAARRGGHPFLQFGDAPPHTFSQVDTLCTRVANALLTHAVAQGERVAVMLPNTLAYCTVWFALSRLGAVHVAVNTGYKGIFLSHVLNNSGARLMILEADYLPWLAEVEPEVPGLHTVFVSGLKPGDAAPFKRIRLLDYDTLTQGGTAPVTRTVQYQDPGCIMYTSGTTGPSKGVLMPQAHLYLFGLGEVDNLAMTERDIYYISMPLFHANAMLMQLYGCLIAGCKAVIVPQFSASRWLDDIRRHGVTITNTLGVMTEFIYRQPPRPEDSQHRLRLICAVPAPKEIARDFMRRFNTRLIEGYGMTEVNIPLYMPLDAPYRPGSCGKPYARYFEVKVVNPDTDEEQPRGVLGEIVVRPREPFGFMQGYNAMPEKTVEAWRNLWFHTGDAGRQDEEGYFFFVDRIKDALRVRGENLSSFEIEAVLCAHPAIEEAAVVAVKSDIAGGEDEILACVVLKSGQRLTPAALLDHCVPRMPYFAVPRYVEFMESLPKTPTQKVRKGQLREQGRGPLTWDRDAAGYRVARR